MRNDWKFAEDAEIAAIKERAWFYEFELPDGSRTKTDLPDEVRLIHTSRRDKLRRIVQRHVKRAETLTALDLASHEGYFSVELARHFAHVRGFDYRAEHINAARLIAHGLGIKNISFDRADLQSMQFDEALCADFVLVFGLLYHLEDPIHTIRLACKLARHHILIETQVFPFDISGRMEEGYYQWQHNVEGVFALVGDNPAVGTGGSSDLALVPSLNALVYLLKRFGFETLEIVEPDAEDYEQFRRGSRVVIYGCRPCPPCETMTPPTPRR
jgi:tRNA (mo5U34)-methyltransferase